MNLTICFSFLCLTAAVVSVADPFLSIGVLAVGGLMLFMIQLFD